MKKFMWPAIAIAAVFFAVLIVTALSQASALSVGDSAPNVEGRAAIDGKIGQFDLKSQLAKHAVVLYFFPAAFSSG